MELGEWVGGWIIENSDNRGFTVQTQGQMNMHHIIMIIIYKMPSFF